MVTARTRLAFLVQVSALLAECSIEDDIVTGIVSLSAPVLGEWAGVYVSDDAGRLRLAASAGPAALGEAVDAQLRGDPQGRLVSTALCGAPLLVEDLEPRADGAPPSALVAPLCLKRKSLGALVVASGEPGHFAEEDLTLAADVGHRTALAVEHARLLREATLAAAAREEFLHVASHELRGPIGTLRLTVQMLARDVRKGSGMEALADRLRLLDRQAQRLARLSDALLDVSRINAGRIELVREEADLAALVRDVAAGFEEEARGFECALAVEAPGPVRCWCDVGRVEQVVTNLLSNAFKYGRGQPVRVSVRADGSRAVVEVEDRGIGIAREDQERIFGRFERAVSGRQYAGLGLGLWIAQRLVEAHGGFIRVRSAPGEGATFAVDLPLGRHP